MNRYIPLSGILELTLACNFNCLHCGSHAGCKRNDELSQQEWKNVITELASMGCKHLTLMGGEITLRPDWLEISKFITGYGIECSVVTNGYLVDEDLVKKMKEVGIKNVSVSLDASSAEEHDKIRGKKGAFERALKTIELASKYGLTPAVITTVNKKNQFELENIYKLLSDYKFNLYWKVELASCHKNKFSEEYIVDEETFLNVCKFISKYKRLNALDNSGLILLESHDVGYMSSIYPNLSCKFSLKGGCNAGICGFGIQSNGNVKGCLALDDNFIEGNIREKPFSHIWNGHKNFKYTRYFKHSYLQGICKDCPMALSKKCSGGCRDFSRSTTGSIYNTPFCLYNSLERGNDSPTLTNN